jgi:hypothetical protein
MGVKLVSASAGSVEIVAPATASNYTATMPAGTGNVVVNGINSSIVSGTSQASTSGTSIDFTSIPSWVKRITVMFNGVSLSGTSNILIQLGDSGGIQNTGYVSSIAYVDGANTCNVVTSTAGFIGYLASASRSLSGNYTFTLVASTTNSWTASAGLYATTPSGQAGGGAKALSATLDRVRITTVNGTDTFDAGSINILYE